MISLLIFLTYTCPNVKIINKTYIWNKRDQKILLLVQKRCKIKFADAPCLKKFYKIAPRRYHAICGGSK